MKNNKESKQLIDLIKEKMQGLEKDLIIRALGYYNKKKGLKKLDELLSAETAEEWLKGSGYDFTHTNESILTKLCEVLDLDKKYYINIIKIINKRLNAISLMPQPYIFINTNFKRTSQTIISLACLEGIRRIYIDKKDVFDSNDDGLSIAKKLVRENYFETKGVAGIWGKIHNYIYFANGKKFTLNKDGEIEVEAEEVFESKATVSVGGREIKC